MGLKVQWMLWENKKKISIKNNFFFKITNKEFFILNFYFQRILIGCKLYKVSHFLILWKKCYRFIKRLENAADGIHLGFLTPCPGFGCNPGKIK